MKSTLSAESVFDKASEQNKYLKNEVKVKKVKFQEEVNMLRPHLIKRVKPAAYKEPIKQKNSRTFIKASEDVCCGENMREYMKSTSLHGMKYISNSNITLFER